MKISSKVACRILFSLVMLFLMSPLTAFGAEKVVVIPLFEAGSSSGFDWSGNWATATNYQKGDVVQYDGSSYIALITHVSSAANQPPNVSTWGLMAEKGETGPAGPLNPYISIDPATSKTAVGVGVLASGAGQSNTAIGYNALHSNTGGYNNTASGMSALYSNQGGWDNTATGVNALYSNTGGNYNTAMGQEALYSNNSGSWNTATGMNALRSNLGGGENTATGAGALYSNTAGNFNVATGALALQSNIDGASNTATGYGALNKNLSGKGNSAFGSNALYKNLGDNNTATGFEALYSNTSGSKNTATGTWALHTNSTGSLNTAYGYGALPFNTADGNTAVGSEALYHNTSGTGNTAIGYQALYDNSTGIINTAVGTGAGKYDGSGNFTGGNNIYIGYYVGPKTADESNTTRIGDAAYQTATYIAGIYNATSSGGTAVYVDDKGKLGTSTSSRRYKEDIEDMGNASSNLMRLRPVAFHYKPEYSDGPRTMQYGLIAEEVAEVYPDLVVYDPKTGHPQTVSYHLINAMLLNEVQKQYKENQDQQRRIDDLEKRLAKLEAMLGQ